MTITKLIQQQEHWLAVAVSCAAKRDRWRASSAPLEADNFETNRWRAMRKVEEIGAEIAAIDPVAAASIGDLKQAL